jgi:hypothetical protein
VCGGMSPGSGLWDERRVSLVARFDSLSLCSGTALLALTRVGAVEATAGFRRPLWLRSSWCCLVPRGRSVVADAAAAGGDDQADVRRRIRCRGILVFALQLAGMRAWLVLRPILLLSFVPMLMCVLPCSMLAVLSKRPEAEILGPHTHCVARYGPSYGSPSRSTAVSWSRSGWWFILRALEGWTEHSAARALRLVRAACRCRAEPVGLVSWRS